MPAAAPLAPPISKAESQDQEVSRSAETQRGMALDSRSSNESRSTFDWTSAEAHTLDGHLLYARSVEWASTPLGAMHTWTQQFRTIVNMVMADTEPVILYWGSERTVLYNEFYVNLIRDFHPCMGRPAFEAFPEYADFMTTIFDRTGQTGETYAVDDMPIFLATPSGQMEEEYVCLKMIPLLSDTAGVAGIYQRATYATVRKCHERR